MFDEDTDELSRIYDTHLLAGHFLELDAAPQELIQKAIDEAEMMLGESKNKSNQEKTIALSSALSKYCTAISLNDKCLITDIEALISFVCIRHPELELSYSTMSRIVALSLKTPDFQEQKNLAVAATLYCTAMKRILGEKLNSPQNVRQ